MACAPDLQGVFMETTRSDSQPAVTMATEQAHLEGEEGEMATDSTGCSGEVCRRVRHTLARSERAWAERGRGSLHVCG